MASDTTQNHVPQALPPEMHPSVEHLVTEDDTPGDNIFSEKQQRLLTEPLYSCWPQPNDEKRFVALANVGLFYDINKPPFVPDMLFSLDVELPDDVWQKRHRCYFTWEYGKMPEVVVEVVSNKEGGEGTDKLTAYARIGVRYYVIYDPEQQLSEQTLRAFQLDATDYREMDDPIWFPKLQLGFRLWDGKYEGHKTTWLRWIDAKGNLIQTGAERAFEAEKRADQEQQRANQEQQRAERLANQLRQLGVEPEE